MAADEHLGLQFEYKPPEMGHEHHMVRAMDAEGTWLGDMDWNARRIGGIQVLPEHQRRGVATALWNEAHRLAEQNAKIPKPKHSPDRTDAGDAWAQAVGGRLPRRVRPPD